MQAIIDIIQTVLIGVLFIVVIIQSKQIEELQGCVTRLIKDKWKK